VHVSGADARGVGVVFGVVIGLAEKRALVRQLDKNAAIGLEMRFRRLCEGRSCYQYGSEK
jgi:hypothetical protein